MGPVQPVRRPLSPAALASLQEHPESKQKSQECLLLLLLLLAPSRSGMWRRWRRTIVSSRPDVRRNKGGGGRALIAGMRGMRRWSPAGSPFVRTHHGGGDGGRKKTRWPTGQVEPGRPHHADEGQNYRRRDCLCLSSPPPPSGQK